MHPDHPDRPRTGRDAGRKTFSPASREARIELLERIVAEYEKRREDIAKAITEEMGAPVWLAQRAQAADGRGAFHDRASRFSRPTSSRRPAARR